ncbi:ABC transporter ATP-binding protein [Rhodohalobacter sp.]|uniref:ABC transporter ATP-binding protein n=1 Tax=Rhodohalobacter sp. TaxID=1974210 RepID=UPI002ACDB1C2|nr:ABC transporter ATP-binding protein [Rhodohalobacter sp.]MDZ7758008.1 ABC transporter ATP-binding protein [Rhodohalobacter sp.]
MSSTPLLEGKNIHFQYGDEVIFDNFNFRIDKGDRVVLKGDSGSGKTTLFRLILGFESLQQGEILYQGNSLKEPETIRNLRKSSSWLPQDLNIGTGLVKDVILFPFTFQAHKKNEPDQSKIESTLHDFGLNPDEILQKSYSDLSTGQRQRVGLAICVMLNQSFILLDEPTSALDHDSKAKAADLLLNQNSRTVLSTSHDSFWVERCEKVIDLNQ